MEGGPPIFGQDSTCPALLTDRTEPLPVRAYHPLWGAVPDASGLLRTTTGLVPVRSPLLRESRLMSFPPGTEMVQFPGFAPPSSRPTVPHARWVTPFGDPRITGCSPLPAAYRSVPRPSSPLGAEASTRCPSPARPAPAQTPRARSPSIPFLFPAAQKGSLLDPLHDVQTTHHQQPSWWARAESNGRPHPYQGCALTS